MKIKTVITTKKKRVRDPKKGRLYYLRDRRYVLSNRLLRVLRDYAHKLPWENDGWHERATQTQRKLLAVDKEIVALEQFFGITSVPCERVKDALKKLELSKILLKEQPSR